MLQKLQFVIEKTKISEIEAGVGTLKIQLFFRQQLLRMNFWISGTQQNKTYWSCQTKTYFYFGKQNKTKNLKYRLWNIRLHELDRTCLVLLKVLNARHVILFDYCHYGITLDTLERETHECLNFVVPLDCKNILLFKC